VTVIQTLAQLEGALKVDFKQDFGDALSALFSNLNMVSGMTPLEIAVYDQGQLVAFAGQLASAAVKFLPEAQQALMSFLQGTITNWQTAQAAVIAAKK